MSKYLTAPVKTPHYLRGFPTLLETRLRSVFPYGMRSILFVYMTTYLMQPGGLLDTFTDQEAKSWTHLFVASAYFFPLMGALLSDAWWGKYRTIITLSLAYCAGHACLAFMETFGDTRAWLFTGLVLIAIGSGGIKPCVSAHVGDQFGQSNGHLLSKVFGWFYFSINFGAFVSGLLTPWLLEARAGNLSIPLSKPWWVKRPKVKSFLGHIGHSVSRCFDGFGHASFWMGRHKFIHIQPPTNASVYFKQTFSKEGMQAIGRISIIFAFIILFWCLFDQIGTTWLLQAKQLDRILPEWIPLVGGKEMLAAQVASVFNPLFILLLIPVFNYWIYPALDKIFPLTPLRKIGLGLFGSSLAFAMVAIIQMAVDAGGEPHVGWQILACLLLTGAEVMVSITGLEFAYTQAPRHMKSFILALFLFTVSLGNFLTAMVTKILTDSQGQAKLSLAHELWFWSVFILIGAIAYVPVAMRYKAKEYLQEEKA